MFFMLSLRGLANVVLVRDGSSDFEIVIRENAPRVTRFAADELATYVQKVTGVKLATVTQRTPGRRPLYVGSHGDLSGAEFAQENYAGKERFRLAEHGDGLVIMGADEEKNPISRDYGDFGLLFGVYEFLERYLGVRWYTPGVFGECFVPKTEVTLTQLPVDQTPNYWSRMVWPYVYNEFTEKESLLWNRRMRMFGTGNGGANHSFMDMYFIYKESRPEIFALKPDGHSREFGNLRAGIDPKQRKWAVYPQFCFSNPLTVQSYCEMIDRWYAGDAEVRAAWKTMPPTDTQIYLVPNDNFTTQPCYCKECQAAIRAWTGVHKGTMSGLVWDFTRKVAEYCAHKYPDKKVMTLAYEGYYQPPKQPLPDNVVVQICVNPYIIYMGAADYRRNFDETLKQWSQKVKEISIWHYLLPYDYFPYAMPHIMYDWHRAYPAIKASFLELNNFTKPGLPLSKHYRPGTSTYDLGQVHLNVYFAMKGMWGTDLDVSEEMMHHCQLFYGPAARPMQAYYELTIIRWQNVGGKRNAKGSAYAKFSGKELYEEIYPPEVVSQMRQLLDEAASLVKPGTIYQERLTWLRTAFLDLFFAAADAYAKEMTVSRDLVLTPYAGAEPVIDGRMDDAFWQTLPEQYFVRFDSPVPPRYPTTFRVGVAGGKLCLALHATDPDSSAQRLTRTSHDSEVFMDDSMELFVVPDPSRPDVYKQIMINLLDVVCDVSLGDGKNYTTGRSYESGIVVKTVRGDGFFDMEFAIPLESLGIAADRNTRFSMNLCRNKRSGVGENHESSQWHCTYNNGFGYLIGAPQIAIVGVGERIIDFSDPSLVVPHVLIPMPNDRAGKPVDKGVAWSIEGGVGRLTVTLDSDNHRYDYGAFTFRELVGAKIDRDSYIEIRFRNPDAAFHHTLSYAFREPDGEIKADYSRFVKNESFDTWRVRAVRIADGGYQGRVKKAIFDPDSIYSVQIYSSGKHDGQARTLEIDYIRITNEPLTEPYIEPK
jgi:hypothetical protein